MILSILFFYLPLLLVGIILIFLSIPILLAALTRPKKNEAVKSAMYVGRVWHTRHLPTKHAFTYPIFMFLIDLEEIELFRQLWPLSWILSFRENDHLKNGEGRQENDGDYDLYTRISRMVREKTKGALVPQKGTHEIRLLTHLCYYGYCFNPVSFYYVQRNNKTEAIVAEVSNTPWNEMYCYILHPSSIDLQESHKRQDGVNYVFRKNFHVSPFMEMDYLYDWIFEESYDKLRVVTGMRRGSTTQFVATLNIHRHCSLLEPFRLAWQLSTYPIYCLIIQIWIHYEAFWLFYKGVSYQPHPEESETTVSRIIGTIMTPLFALQDMLKK